MLRSTTEKPQSQRKDYKKPKASKEGETMRRRLSLLLALQSLLLVSLLGFVSSAFAQKEVDACFNFLKAEDYKRAIEAGEKNQVRLKKHMLS